jgi:hypothetical protein
MKAEVAERQCVSPRVLVADHPRTLRCNRWLVQRGRVSA